MQLCNGNYLWWWRSFWVGASGALYIVIYCTSYVLMNLDKFEPLEDISVLIYIGLLALCYGCASGAVSVYASFYFTTNIYKNIRNE